MRAMTVRQPWAWAIIHGQKDIENRSRNIAGSYRGPVAITAALALDPEAWLPNFALQDSDAIAKREPRGAVLGVADLIDVHHAAWSREVACWRHGQSVPRCSEWSRAEYYHLVLANPRPLPTPIPVRGRLGLWTLPDDVAAQIEEALR